MSGVIGEEIGSSRTPGPWSIDTSTGLDVRGPDGKDVCVALCQEMDGMVFKKDTIGPELREQAFDNALLIAAAPDLLALAKQYASSCITCCGHGFTYEAGEPFTQEASNRTRHTCEECEHIRDVIAKAEGRS